jgi:hypothetical protein
MQLLVLGLTLAAKVLHHSSPDAAATNPSQQVLQGAARMQVLLAAKSQAGTKSVPVGAASSGRTAAVQRLQLLSGVWLQLVGWRQLSQQCYTWRH